MKGALRVLAAVAALTGAEAFAALPPGLRTALLGVSPHRRTMSFPDIADADALASVLDGFTDPGVATNLTTTAAYDAYRGWAAALGLSRPALRASPTAWLSYALDAGTLLAEAPQPSDLAIDAVRAPSADGDAALVFSLKNVAVGAEADDARLRTVFGVDAADTPAADAFAPADVTFAPSGDGRVRATVAPPERPAASRFLRVRMP